MMPVVMPVITPVHPLDSAPVHQGPAQQTHESGFMLAASGVFILVIIALLSSFAFIANRDSRFKEHYAAGQQAATMIIASHSVAQRIYYEDMNGTGSFDGDEIEYQALPAIKDVEYDVIINASTNSPITSTSTHQAASAYAHIKIRYPAAKPMLPSDMTAFMAGAAQRGLSRIGIVGKNIPAGDSCDSLDTVVRWGPEDTACLNDNHLGTLAISDVQDGDVIVPVWESALATGSRTAMYRFKQPERPDLNIMQQNLVMNAFDIESVKDINSDTFTANDTAQLQELYVRNGGETRFNQATTINAPLNILDADATSTTTVLTVNAPVQFTQDMSVAAAINQGPSATSRISTTVANPVGVDTLNTLPGAAMNIDPIGSATLTVAALLSTGVPNSLTLDGSGKTLVVGNNLTAGSNTRIANAVGKQLHLYTGAFTTNTTSFFSPAVTMTLTGTETTRFTVGAIEQIGLGATKYLQIPRIHTGDCHGRACPDYETETPGGGF